MSWAQRVRLWVGVVLALNLSESGPPWDPGPADGGGPRRHHLLRLRRARKAESHRGAGSLDGQHSCGEQVGFGEAAQRQPELAKRLIGTDRTADPEVADLCSSPGHPSARGARTGIGASTRARPIVLPGAGTDSALAPQVRAFRPWIQGYSTREFLQRVGYIPRAPVLTRLLASRELPTDWACDVCQPEPLDVLRCLVPRQPLQGGLSLGQS